MSIANKVKIAILEMNGETNPDPSSLPASFEMSEFSFNQIQIIELSREFTRIARQTNSSGNVSPSQVDGCDIVQDCIDVTTTAANI